MRTRIWDGHRVVMDDITPSEAKKWEFNHHEFPWLHIGNNNICATLVVRDYCPMTCKCCRSEEWIGASVHLKMDDLIDGFIEKAKILDDEDEIEDLAKEFERLAKRLRRHQEK